MHFKAPSADSPVPEKRAVPRPVSPRSKTRTIAIASGKGGAGKTSMAACLAWILAERRNRVCLLDVDLGLSNVDVLLGISPQYTLEDVILKGVPIERAITRVRPGLDVISGGSGAASLADLSKKQRTDFLARLNALDGYDFLLLDNAPGIHRQVVAFCLAAREQVILINPEPSSVTDGYALLKVLRQNGLRRPPYILLNRVPAKFDHAKLLERFAEVCKKHLHIRPLPLGSVPDDWLFRQAAIHSVLPVSLQPQSQGCLALARIATLLVKRVEMEPETIYSNARGFFASSLSTLFQGLEIPGETDPVLVINEYGELRQVLNRLDILVTKLERAWERHSSRTPPRPAPSPQPQAPTVKAGQTLPSQPEALPHP